MLPNSAEDPTTANVRPSQRDLLAEDTLAKAIQDTTKSRLYIVLVFVLISSPGIMNMFHLLLYVFIAADDPYWCAIPQLSDAGWSDEQIRNISSPSRECDSCKYYDNDYGKLAGHKYEAALKLANKTKLLRCKDFEYANNYTIVKEWGLVCEWADVKPAVAVSLSVGKATGATLFGWMADRWGRKRSLMVSSLLYILAAHVGYFSPWLSLYIVTRLLVGMGGVGCYNCGFVLLTELCDVRQRQTLGILFNLSYGVGMLLLALIAYYVRPWRDLQLYVSLPTLLLLVEIWLLPESPKWLCERGRTRDMWNVVRSGNKIRRFFCQKPIPIDEQAAAKENLPPMSAASATSVSPPVRSRCSRIMGKFYPLLTIAELRTRMLIKLFLWVTITLTYYTLSLNCDNFRSNRYVFTALAGVTELVGYLIPLPLLHFLGRTTLELLLFGITGFSLLILIIIPFENQVAILIVAMVARTCATAAFAVIILHTSELFPVEVRNTAFGLISTVSCVGAMVAPLLVTLIGHINNKLPTTVCGVTMVVSALLARVLPETKDLELSYTIEEELTRQKVSLRNCYKIG